jgi:zinc-ribbon domain
MHSAGQVRGKTKTLLAVFLATLAIVTLFTAAETRPSSNIVPPGNPVPIPQGPIGRAHTSPGDPYWFQQGAIGDSSTYSSVGASVMIRTVYDKMNNDAHSYWVGSILSNGAFVQVGYLNGLTTTGQYYCCAWFFEFFPSGNTNSPPIIGPAGSAGPIGSWHTYTMNYTGNYVWSFYIDNQYLGSSPTSGQQYFLGTGDTNSGNHAVAALSEVAQASDDRDIIGPAEFRRFQYETTPGGWTSVPTGKVHWGYGVTSSTSLSNPYSVTEIQGTPNDFLTGSAIPRPGNDQCGNPAPYNSNPTIDANLWSTTLTCFGGTTNSFSFIDETGAKLTPSWISLNDSSSKQIFYTDYQSYQGLTVPSPSGKWTIGQASWHAVNVAIPIVVNTSQMTNVFPTTVFQITLAIVGYFYALPVKDSSVLLYLPDSTNQTVKTDGNGEGTFTQLPPSTYTFRISVPYGVTSNKVETLTGSGSLVERVFSLPELLTILVPPIFIAILVAVVVARREHRRQAEIQAQAPLPSAGPRFCRNCGQPLAPTANFCTSCGTPTGTIVQ